MRPLSLALLLVGSLLSIATSPAEPTTWTVGDSAVGPSLALDEGSVAIFEMEVRVTGLPAGDDRVEARLTHHTRAERATLTVDVGGTVVDLAPGADTTQDVVDVQGLLAGCFGGEGLPVTFEGDTCVVVLPVTLRASDTEAGPVSVEWQVSAGVTGEEGDMEAPAGASVEVGLFPAE